MYQLIKKSSLLLALSISFFLASCGGGGSSSGGTVSDTVSINGTSYSANSTLYIEGLLFQISQYGSLYGGPTAFITMNDRQTGNSLFFQITTTVDGWPGVYSLFSNSADTRADITDKSVTTGGLMAVMNNVAGGEATGGSITINAFGEIGQPIKGSFNINMCDRNATCPASLKNYTGSFNINRVANYGSITRPAYLTPMAPASAYASPNGISPATGKNYYTVASNATGGTLTITLTPSVDVNMAVYTDAGFTTPATCNVTNTLNVVGNVVETCAITVAANQRLYFAVGQVATATAFETYTLKVTE